MSQSFRTCFLASSTSWVSSPGSCSLHLKSSVSSPFALRYESLPQFSAFSGPDNLENLRKLAEHFQKKASGATAASAQEDDDDVPDLVPGETFEAAAEAADKAADKAAVEAPPADEAKVSS